MARPPRDYETRAGNGFVKIHRSIMEKGWYKDSDAVLLWIHLILSATHSEREYLWNGRTIVLSPGQFVTGRKKLASETGISEGKIRRLLNLFKNDQQISQQISSTSSLITIINYTKYQVNDQRNNQRPTNDQPTDDQRATNEQPLNKNVKNDKKGKNIYKVGEDWIFGYDELDRGWVRWVEYRAETGKPITTIAAERQIAFLQKFSGPVAVEIIEQSIRNQWQGLFELKNNINGKNGKHKPGYTEQLLAWNQPGRK